MRKSTGYFPYGSDCMLCVANLPLVIGFSVAIFVIIVLVSFAWSRTSSRSHGFFYRLRNKFKILLSFSQILFSMTEVFVLSFPVVFESFLDNVLSLVSLSFVGDFVGIDCLVETNFYSKFLVQTLTPLAVCLVLGIVYGRALIVEHTKNAALQLSRVREEQAREAHREERHESEVMVMSTVLLMTYIILPTVSVTIFNLFACESFDDGTRMLMVDYSISCQTDTYTAYKVLGVFMVLVWPLGVPLLYLAVLYRRRHRLNPAYWVPECKDMDEEQICNFREENSRNDNIRFLFDMYRPKTWWWEVLETFRRLLLAGALVVFDAGSALQYFCGLWICLVALLLYAYWVPFIAVADTQLAIGAQLQIFNALWIGILRSMDDPSSEDEDVGLGVILIIMTLFIFALAIFLELEDCCISAMDLREGRQKVRQVSSRLIRKLSSRQVTEEETVVVEAVHDAGKAGFEHSNPLHRKTIDNPLYQETIAEVEMANMGNELNVDDPTFEPVMDSSPVPPVSVDFELEALDAIEVVEDGNSDSDEDGSVVTRLPGNTTNPISTSGSVPTRMLSLQSFNRAQTMKTKSFR